MPKIDWGAYDRHRIDGKTRISQGDWARIITGTKDFSGILSTLVRTATTLWKHEYATLICGNARPQGILP